MKRKYGLRRWWSEYGWIVWTGMVLAAIIATGIIWYLSDGAKRSRCEANGGRIIEIQNSHGWFCEGAEP